MQKTVVVSVTRTYRHHLYGKVISSNKRYQAHDELGAKIGDTVLIVESKPISRNKRFVVQEILERSISSELEPVDAGLVIEENQEEEGTSEPETEGAA